MKKQIMFLAILVMSVMVYPIKSDVEPKDIYKISSLLTVAAIGFAVNNVNSIAAPVLGSIAASGFFFAPLVNMKQEDEKLEKVKRGAMGVASSLVYGAWFNALLTAFKSPAPLILSQDVIFSATK